MSNIARRQVVRALAAAPLAGLPLATVLADPRLARAAAAGLEEVWLTTQGGKAVTAALAMPAVHPAPAVLLVHEWWGLNDQIKSVAAALAEQGYIALAVDLYDGKIATQPDQAQSLMQAVKDPVAADTLKTWVTWLRTHKDATGKIGTVGWCFGGGWSLNASIASPVDATVIYYGRVNQPADELAALKGPVLGHFATRDGWIDKNMVDGFRSAMAAAGKHLEAHWYEADHAFANPTQARYDAEDAMLAWARTLAFFKTHLMT